jgi:hypothetical protein
MNLWAFGRHRSAVIDRIDATTIPNTGTSQVQPSTKTSTNFEEIVLYAFHQPIMLVSTPWQQVRRSDCSQLTRLARIVTMLSILDKKDQRLSNCHLLSALLPTCQLAAGWKR